MERVDEEISNIEQRHAVVQERWSSVAERVRAQKSQMTRLNGIINEADEELAAQTKQYNCVVNEERVLAHQLVKRNEELSNVYERLRLQNSMMKKGAEHYKDKRVEFQKLVDAKTALTNELDSISYDREEIDRYRSAIAEMEKMLLRDRLRVRALEGKPTTTTS